MMIGRCRNFQYPSGSPTITTHMRPAIFSCSITSTLPHCRSDPRQASLSHFPVSAQGVRLPRAATLGDCGHVAQALEGTGQIGNDLVDAGDEKHPARAKGIGGDTVARAVGVDDLPGRR